MIQIVLISFQMHAKTTVALSPSFATDRLWLNGVEESVETNVRLNNCLREVRRRARKRHDINGDAPANDLEHLTWKVHVCSENNFPTAAGLASSAAGYACLGKKAVFHNFHCLKRLERYLRGLSYSILHFIKVKLLSETI